MLMPNCLFAQLLKFQFRKNIGVAAKEIHYKLVCLDLQQQVDLPLQTLLYQTSYSVYQEDSWRHLPFYATFIRWKLAIFVKQWIFGHLTQSCKLALKIKKEIIDWITEDILVNNGGTNLMILSINQLCILKGALMSFYFPLSDSIWWKL